MGLVMVCPQCQAKVLLQCQNCPYCQSDLRDVPQDQRRYMLGQPGPSTPPSAAEAAIESIPVLESASVPEITSQPAPGPETTKSGGRMSGAMQLRLLPQLTRLPAKHPKEPNPSPRPKRPKNLRPQQLKRRSKSAPV